MGARTPAPHEAVARKRGRPMGSKRRLPGVVSCDLLIILSVLLFSQLSFAAVSVTISPTSASLGQATTQKFTATVKGSSNTGVTWKVNGITGGNASVGTVSTSG